MRKATNPDHGWQTIKNGTLKSMQSRGHGKKCGDCKHFDFCSKPMAKGVKKETDYCQWPNHIRIHERIEK